MYIRKGVNILMKKLNIVIFTSLIMMMLLITGCGFEKADKNPPEIKQETSIEKESQTNEGESKEGDERIVAATFAITEFMEVLDIDLVGVPSSYKDLPKRYEEVTEIGNPMWPDMEVVMSLKPTNLLTVTTLKEDLEEELSEIGAPATYLDLESVSSMLEEIENLGSKYNRENQATEFVADYKEQMENLEAKVNTKEKPKVLILMGIPGSYIVGTEHSYIGDLVESAGGINAVIDREEEYISANTEYLQQLEPDIILRAAHGAPEEVIKMFDKEFAENDIWKHFKAVKDDRVYDLEETRFGTTANLAALEALEELIDLLHPKN